MSSIHQPGNIIQAKYRLTGILGKGGVAITYSAIDLKTNSPLAIKVISLKQLDRWKQVELFQREAEVLKQLSHPYIPDYIDYFDLETETDKSFYLVQQLAPGKSLYQLVESGWRVGEKEVKNIARQVLEILAYLHSLDPPVIHRDIKPSNLIRSNDGKIYLVDFGAVQNTYYNTLMQGSTVVGTYGYMSPEQFRGQALPATDLYSLGATLLYLLTHRSPAELPQDTLKLDFRSAVNISESFADWLEKILEPDIEDRFRDADVALVELFKGNKKKQKKIFTGISVISLLMGLFIGINSYKWFFLSRFGFSPDKLCYPDTLNNFFEQKGNINYLEKKIQINLLSCTVLSGEIDIVKQIIAHSDNPEELINSPNTLGKDITPFRNAIWTNKYELIKLLIDNGADINAKDKYGVSPLSRGVVRSHMTVFMLLIENGADVNIKNIDGDTPLFYAVYWDKKEKAQTLIEHGANVNAINNKGKTPLFYSTMNKSTEIVKLLIENGADIHIKDRDNNNILSSKIEKPITIGRRLHNEINRDILMLFKEQGLIDTKQ